MVEVSGWNIPALEWCSIGQACRWIVLQEMPVAAAYEGLLLRECSDLDESGYAKGWEAIKAQARLAAVPLKGRRVTEIRQVTFTGGEPWFDTAEYGAIEPLPPEKMGRAQITADGVVYWHDGGLPDNWQVYFPVQVDFGKLIEKYPRPAGMTFRIGGEAVPVEKPKPRRLTFDIDAWITLQQAAELVQGEGESAETARNRLEYRLGQRLINVGYLVRVSPDERDGYSLDLIHIHKDDFPWQLAHIDWDRSVIDLRGISYRLFNPFNQTAEIRLCADDVRSSEADSRFSRETDAKSFRGPSLTLPQVLRWLLYQDIVKVNRTDAHATLTETCIAHLGAGPNTEAEFTEALDTVHAAITNGRLTLTAIRADSMEPTRIEPYEMAHLRFIDTDAMGRLSVCLALATASSPATAVRYREPRFLPHEVLALREDKAQSKKQTKKVGNAAFDDAEMVRRAIALFRSGKEKSARRAARAVVLDAINEGQEIRGASIDAWETRIRKKMGEWEG